MPAAIRLLGWSAEGLRCPNHTVDMTRDGTDVHPVTLIQMPNGTGKTTTLRLLRAALSGSASENSWTNDKVMEYRKRRSDVDAGEFKVSLSVDGRRVTIVMEFDFVAGEVAYRTIRGDGQVARFDPPHSVARFLSPDFVEYFVFDGELAAELLDHEHASAETIVDRLFQVKVLKSLRLWVQDFWQQRANAVSAVEERGFARRKNRVEQLRSRLEKLEREEAEVLRKIDGASRKLKAENERYQNQISQEEERNLQLASAESTLHNAELAVSNQTGRVLEAMADPHAISASIADAMMRLKSGLDRVKLPESAAREWFHELASEELCVCGRPITEEIRPVILARAERYLGTDDVALLNSMKAAIHDAVGVSIDGPELVLSKMLRELAQLVNDETEARNSRDALRDAAEESDPSIRSAMDRIRGIEGEIRSYEQALEQLRSSDDSLKDESQSIPVISERLDNAERHLAEISNTLELRAKRDALTSILDEAYSLARSRVNHELKLQTNQRIERLLPRNQIRVSEVGSSLLLEGQSGGSVGEQLSIAYAFLATLFDRTDHELPFVVDSPAGALDPDVRRQIGALVPKLGKQFVAFTIASEREAFLPAIERASSSELHYITMFRKDMHHYTDLLAEVNGVVDESSDGIVVRGAPFFKRFQDSQEPEEEGGSDALSS